MTADERQVEAGPRQIGRQVFHPLAGTLMFRFKSPVPVESGTKYQSLQDRIER